MRNAEENHNATSLCEEQWPWNSTGSIFQVVGYGLIVIPVSTVVLNIAEVVFVLKAPKLKLHTRTFLISLAFCDLLIGLTVMPFRILGIVTNNSQMFGETGCDIGNSLEVLLLSASVWHMCALTFERCIASRRPFQLDYWFGKRNGSLIFTTCWIVPAVLAFGLIFPRYHALGLEKENKCIKELSASCRYISNTYYSIVLGLFVLLVPAIIIIICNRNTMSAILDRQRVLYKLANINSKRASFNRLFFGTTLSRTVLTMTSVSFIFWLPLFTLYVVDPFISHRTPRFVWAVCSWFCYSHSTINPLLYMKCAKVFRYRSFFMS